MIEKRIAELPSMTDAALKGLLENTGRPEMRGRDDAARLRTGIEAEFVRRRVARIKREGDLWWESHDADFPQCHGYADAEATRRVATILKRTTHKAEDKEVYSVEVMGVALAGRFHHVADARAAGAAAWASLK
ncbi:MAG: hypothetical protein U1A24_16085 [Cypionkella sp.]|uniref:hypothetical protein n=1 Tax=Cypionkella sp. TaxID=2811411 RepID=UPI002AB968B9|nr:hypothetical protein [Cypionkella sp.]MDZ4312067.1 hypothetical protein [Cypionkella sp.]